MTYALTPGTPRAASAAAFGRELVKACAARGVPRKELWRVTGIGRTALDNYRTGTSLPRTEAAAALAAVLDWPKLLDIVRDARTRACRRCGRPFRAETGSGAKRYCTVACREIAGRERLANTRVRQAGQTDDNRRRYQALARLRSGMRIAEEHVAELQSAVDAMCAACEPGGVCRTLDCPLRAFSPLPVASHEVGEARTGHAIRQASWTPARRRQMAAFTAQLHRDGRVPKPRDLPANDPARREAWIESIREGKRRKRAAA